MSEYDRGAYTPPTEESFAFDARTPQVRRPVPATLIGSVVVLVVLVGAVALFYWSGVRGAGEAPRVVGKPQLQIKSPPPADAKPIAGDDGKLDVYDEEKGQAAAAPASNKTAFAPPPEQPQPRPTAPVSVQAQAAPPPVQAAAAAKPAPAPAASSAPVRAAAAPASQSQPVPAVRPNDAVSNLLARNEAPATAAAAAAAKAAPPAKAQAAPADAAHGVMVQIGAFSSSAIADEEFAKAKSAFASYTSGRGKHVERAEVGGKVYWRTAFTGFDHASARAFCRALIAAKKGCIVR